MSGSSGLSGTCPSSNQTDPTPADSSAREQIYVTFQPSFGRSTKACLRIQMSAVRKDEGHAAVLAFARTGGWFYEKTGVKSSVHSQFEKLSIFAHSGARARRWKIWVTRASASITWKFVSGMFAGIVAVAPRAWKREESRFRGLNVDALSNTRLTLWEGRNAAGSRAAACTCVRFPGWPRLLAGLQKTLLYVLLLRRGR